MRSVMRWSTGRSLLAIDIRFFSFAVIAIGLGVAFLFVLGPAAGVVTIALGLVVLAGAVLAAIFDFMEELPARRFEKRVAHRDRRRGGDRPSGER
jgi:hypothetical protein